MAEKWRPPDRLSLARRRPRSRGVDVDVAARLNAAQARPPGFGVDVTGHDLMEGSRPAVYNPGWHRVRPSRSIRSSGPSRHLTDGPRPNSSRAAPPGGHGSGLAVEVARDHDRDVEGPPPGCCGAVTTCPVGRLMTDRMRWTVRAASVAESLRSSMRRKARTAMGTAASGISWPLSRSRDTRASLAPWSQAGSSRRAVVRTGVSTGSRSSSPSKLRSPVVSAGSSFVSTPVPGGQCRRGG